MTTTTAKKKTRGRPALPAHLRRVRREFTLPQDVIEMAERIGNGNASAGAETAIRQFAKKNFLLHSSKNGRFSRGQL